MDVSPALDALNASAAPAFRSEALESAKVAVLLGAGALAGLFAGAPPLTAAEPLSPMAQGLLGLPVTEQAIGAQRFATPDGALRFTLDRSLDGVALMRVDGRSEVLALTPAPGPHGDEFLKDDTGRVVLRVTAVGELIVYTDRAGNGAPATLEGRASPLAGPTPPPEGLSARLAALERETSRAVGHAVSFEAPPGTQLVNAATVAVVADAAARAAEGVSAAKPASLARVAIDLGRRAEARLEPGALRVTVVPRLGYAGRPSAEAVEAVLRGSPR